MTTFLQSGAKERRKLDKVRDELAALEDEIETIAAASFAVDESLDRILRIMDEKRRLADVQLSYFTRPGDGPVLPDLNLGFLAALLGPTEIEARLRTRLEQLTPAPGLPRAERERTLADLRAKCTALEEAEEREVCALEAAGFVVDRRGVDPELALRVWDALETSSAAETR